MNIWINTVVLYDNHDRFMGEFVTRDNEPPAYNNLQVGAVQMNEAAVVFSRRPDGTMQLLKNRWGKCQKLPAGVPRPSKANAQKAAEQRQQMQKLAYTFDRIHLVPENVIVRDKSGDLWRRTGYGGFEYKMQNDTVWREPQNIKTTVQIDQYAPFEVVEQPLRIA